MEHQEQWGPSRGSAATENTVTKVTRVQMFDIKNVIGQELFQRKTTDFTDCFKNKLTLLKQCDNWFHTLRTHCKKLYPLIRIQSKTVKSSSADNLIIQRNELKHHIEDVIAQEQTPKT